MQPELESEGQLPPISPESTNAKKRKAFSVDVITLVSGTAIAQLIAVLSSPIVTRLYGAEAYGLLAVFSSLVSTLVVVACLRYEMAIMLPEDDRDAANLLAVCAIIAASFSIILVPTLWFFSADIARLLSAPGLTSYLWLIPILVLLSSSFAAINYWNTRQRHFERLSRTQVARAVTVSGTQLGMGFSGFSSGGHLIGAYALGQAIATSSLGLQMWRSDKRLLRDSIRFDGIKRCMARYRDYPRYDIWSALLSTVSLQMPIFILSAFFSSATVGYYALGLMVLQLPAGLIGSAIGQVFFQRASEAKRNSDAQLAVVVEGTAKRLVLLGAPIFLLLAVIGEEAFMVVYGAAWGEAGVYSQILSIWILVSFITSPLSTLFSIFYKLRPLLIFNVISLLVRSAALIVGAVFNDVYLSLALFAMTGAVLNAMVGRWFLVNSGVSVSALLRSISRPMTMALVSLGLVAVVKYLRVGSPLLILCVGVIAVVPYYLTLIKNDEEIRSLLNKIIPLGTRS